MYLACWARCLRIVVFSARLSGDAFRVGKMKNCNINYLTIKMMKMDNIHWIFYYCCLLNSTTMDNPFSTFIKFTVDRDFIIGIP